MGESRATSLRDPGTSETRGNLHKYEGGSHLILLGLRHSCAGLGGRTAHTISALAKFEMVNGRQALDDGTIDGAPTQGVFVYELRSVRCAGADAGIRPAERLR